MRIRSTNTFVNKGIRIHYKPAYKRQQLLNSDFGCKFVLPGLCHSSRCVYLEDIQKKTLKCWAFYLGNCRLYRDVSCHVAGIRRQQWQWYGALSLPQRSFRGSLCSLSSDALETTHWHASRTCRLPADRSVSLTVRIYRDSFVRSVIRYISFK